MVASFLVSVGQGSCVRTESTQVREIDIAAINSNEEWALHQLPARFVKAKVVGTQERIREKLLANVMQITCSDARIHCPEVVNQDVLARGQHLQWMPCHTMSFGRSCGSASVGRVSCQSVNRF